MKREKMMEIRGGEWEGKPGKRIKEEGEDEKVEKDRPEFVHLASMSSWITSQNGQTQTEDRKMDVRGCIKGKGGGTMKRKKEGNNIKRWLRMLRVFKVREEVRGHNTTTIRHNDRNEHRKHK